MSEETTVMILGAGQLQVPILHRAKERGYKVIAVSPDINQPGMVYADEAVLLDVRDEEGILAAAKKYKINGIITDQTDLPVRTAAYVADKLGLAGIGYETGCLFTDKYKQRQKCEQLGIASPRYMLSHSLKQAEDAIRYISFPAIIKPIDSQSSHGVSKINSIDELRDKYQKAVSYSRVGGVLLEQYIEGIEFPVDSYVLDGKCTLMAIGQYHMFDIKDVFSSYETVYPAQQPEKVLKMIEETNKKVVEGFGLKTGRTHAEYIVSNEKCYLVEIGARGGGSFFSSDDVRYITGISSEDFLLDFAVGKKVFPRVNEQERCGCCCTLFFYLPENGVVQSVDGLEDVLNLPYIRRNNIDQIHVGMRTRPVVDKGARMFLVVVAKSYEQLEDRVGNIRNCLLISTVGKDGIIRLPIWK